MSFLFLATWARTSTSSNVNFPPADPPPTPNFPRPQGCVAWVSHLGRRAPWIAAYLVARGHPSNPPADGIVSFFARNVPLALVFALPHSLLRPARLYRAPYIGRFGRLLYNILSAVTLHIFLLGFTPLSSPVVMVLPLPEKFHALLSVSCLFAAVSAFLLTPETWGLLGAGQLLGWSGRWRSNPERVMDAITWMGVTAWRAGAAVGGPITGALAFVAFTGSASSLRSSRWAIASPGSLPPCISANDLGASVFGSTRLRARTYLAGESARGSCVPPCLTSPEQDEIRRRQSQIDWR